MFEFVKEAETEGVMQIILFGSVAKEEADLRSDIDFFIVVKDKRIKNKIQEIGYQLEKKYDRSIQLTFSDPKFKGFDESFLEDIFREGIILFSLEPVIRTEKLKLTPCTLFSFSLVDLSQSEKMKVKRALYGGESYSTYKNKIYKSKVKGLIPEKCKIGKGCVLVKGKQERAVEGLFERFKIKYRKTKIWKSEL